MHVLIAYATTEGQTRKIVRFVADWLRDRGHRVELHDTANPMKQLRLFDYDRILVAGSLHVGRYQSALVQFARDHAVDLADEGAYFLSVSLSALESGPAARAELDDCVDHFVAATGWRPARVHHVAGAIRFTKYDFFRRWTIRYVASQKKVAYADDEDVEFTDWQALEDLADELAGPRPLPAM